MANPKHLEILKQGVEVWNKWREEHPDEKIDLEGANLQEANLQGADLSWTNLGKAHLAEADLSEAILYRTNLRDATLTKANLREATLRRADLGGATLTDANLERANLWNVNLWKAILTDANLSEADLVEATLIRTKLSKANITGANLYGTARDDWIIDGIICDYVFWDLKGKKRTPSDRDFRPGEFEELYRSLPTFEYVFEHGFTPIDAVVMDRVVQAINDKHPEFELRLSTLDSRGQSHAVFTVVHKDHLEEAQQQVTTNFERRLAALEGKQEQMMELFARIADNPKTIELIMGDKRMIQTSRDYLEHVEGDVTTGESTSEPKKEP